MNTKIIGAICACVFLISLTALVMVALTVNQDFLQQQDSSNDMSLELSTTVSEVNSTVLTGSAMRNLTITPLLVIGAPIPCEPSERYVAAKKKCEKSL